MIGKFFFTYVLKSKSDNKLYVGWTTSLEKRIAKHNVGLVTATRSRIPFELLYFEACLEKRLAIVREKQLKTGFGRSYLKRRLKL